MNEKQVRYLIVGGYAVGFHGHPRYTKDIDIWIAVSPDNAKRMADALEAYFGSRFSEERLQTENVILRIGVPPNQIEIMTAISGVEFEKCYTNRVQGEIDGLSVPLIGLRDLRINKKASGRGGDIGDLENLPPA